MSQDNQAEPALGREWLIARIVLIAGFVIALGVAAYLGLAARQRVVAARQAVAAKIAAEHKAEAELAAAKDKFCPSALAAAKALGALPLYAVAAEKGPRGTNMKGRYVCIMATQVALYPVVADFMCPDLSDPRCLSLYAVAQAGKRGGLIYQRDKKK